MNTFNTKVVTFVTGSAPKLPQNSIVNIDGSTIYAVNAKLIRLLSEGLRAQYEIIVPPDNAIGTKQPDGNWSGKLGMIFRSEVDLVMGGMFITDERFEAMNFTFPHVVSRITFLTNKPKPMSKNLAIFYPFSYEVWINISLFFLAVALLFYVCLNRKVPLQRVALITAGSIFEQQLDFKMQTNVLRILTSAWILGVTVLSYSYKAVLLSFLSFPTLSGIRDIPDLSVASTDGSFKCFAPRGGFLVGYLLKSQDDSWKAIGECLNRSKVETGDVDEAFHTSASKKALFGSSYGLSSHMNGDYFISEDSFSIALGGIPFSKNFCCPNRLNALVHRIFASGILNKFSDDNNFLSQLQKKSFKSDASETVTKIHLDDISGAFYILASGWLLSFIVLFLEILIAKYLPQAH